MLRGKEWAFTRTWVDERSDISSYHVPLSTKTFDPCDNKHELSLPGHPDLGNSRSSSHSCTRGAKSMHKINQYYQPYCCPMSWKCG